MGILQRTSRYDPAIQLSFPKRVHMKAIICLFASCFLGSTAILAQAVPAASGGTRPGPPFVYAVRYSDTAQFANRTPTIQASALSGTVDYVNRSARLPFSMEYGGGYIWTLSGPAYQTGQFHHLLLSQGIDFRRWKYSFSNNVSYLPQSPTVGFSGIPGLGEGLGGTTPTGTSSQTILTESTHVLDNALTGGMEHSLNYATTLGIGGGYELLTFPDVNGLDVNTTQGYAQLVRRFSSRTELTGRAGYSLYTFPGTPYSITSGTATLGLMHRWTRNFRTTAAAGPMLIKSTLGSFLPSKLNYAITSSAIYTMKNTDFSGSYIHGTSSGSGYLYGGISDTVMGGYRRVMGLNTVVSLMGGYFRTAGLTSAIGVTNAEFGGAEATWHVTGKLIVFADYTATNQNIPASLSGTALDDLRHIVGFGFGFSSLPTRTQP